MCRFLIFLTVLSFCFHTGFAQEITKNHTVKKGETLYQISKIYNVSVAELINLNPDSKDVIYIGNVLEIPNSENQVALKTDSDKISTYNVKRGETKFGLSKKFGISIRDLENQNPHIKNGLQTGHTLKINSQISSSSSSEAINPSNSNGSNITTHLVKKGETLYGISKANSLTVSELQRANTDVLSGVLRTGTLLKIPQRNNNSNSLVVTNSYLVKKGDTKYGLSKKFNVSIKELEASNPQIVKILNSGETLKIPSTSNNLLAENNNQTAIEESDKELNNIENKVSDIETPKAEEDIVLNKSYISYVVKTKETLYGLSKQAGMTTQDFLILNPQLSESVKVGTVIKMPSNDLNQSVINNNVNPLTNTSVGEYQDLRLSVDNQNKKNILITMPFLETELSSNEKNATNVNASPTFQNIEFYRGMKMAIDSLKTLGINFNATFFTANPNNNSQPESNSQIELKQYDAVLAPFNSNSNPITLESLNKNTPLIVTYSPSSNSNNTAFFEALPSVALQRKKTLDYLNNNNGNIIVISDKKRQESREFIKNYTPSAYIIETKKNGVFKESDLILNLDKTKTNYIVIDSEKNGVFLSSTNLLLKELSNYKIQMVVLETSLIPNSENISTKRFSILNMIYPTINQTSNNSQTLRYLDSYKSLYHSNASESVLLGFDITFDTILRVSQTTSFEVSAVKDKTSYLALKFDYKKNSKDRYVNNEILIIEYTSN